VARNGDTNDNDMTMTIQMVEGFLDGDEFSVLMTDVQTYPAVKKVYLREGALCLDFKADWIDNSYEMVPVPDQELGTQYYHR
jgi:hypothetical protein